MKSYCVPILKFLRRNVDFFLGRDEISRCVKRRVGAVYINISIRYEKYKLESLAMLPYLLLKKMWSNRQRAKEVTNEIYNGLQALSSTVGVLENERIGLNKSSKKSANHRANIT